MVYEKIVTCISEILGMDEEGLSISTHLSNDLEMAPIDLAKLIIAIEEALHITIYDEDVSDFQTIGDLVNYCETQLHTY